MIIKSLEIYGYGQFVQRKIEFNRQFTEIFVRMKLVNLLFKHLFTLFCSDFLLKVQRTRLEPRLGNQYGGNYHSFSTMALKQRLRESREVLMEMSKFILKMVLFEMKFG